jgi:hypothetical protein
VWSSKAALGLGPCDHFRLHALLFGPLSSLLFVGGRHQQAQQIAQRIDRGTHLAAKAKLGSIIVSMTASFKRRLQGATLTDSRRGLSVAPLGFAQDVAALSGIFGQQCQVGSDKAHSPSLTSVG